MLKSKITARYEKHACERVCQGDILRDFDFKLYKEEGSLLEVFFPYIIVLSQDCDLHFGLKPYEPRKENTSIDNQFLPSILFLPASPAESVREGTHLKNVFGIDQERVNTEKWKGIKQNKNDRYHYLHSFVDYQIPELVVDFKMYFTLPQEYFILKHGQCYLATVNELFREYLSQRFSNYLNRIGLPELVAA
jgi:hypothetical protein